jgi:tetratricopeptide (TPR) repeat protein
MAGLSAIQSVRCGTVVLVAAGALVFGAPAASGQIELAVMQGIVRDDAGNPLEGVSFRIRDLERGREVAIKSDKEGRFYRRGLPAVEYEIFVEKEGYHPIHDKLRLNAGVDRRFDFKLVKAAPEGAEEFARGVDAFNRADHQAAAQAFEEAVKKAPQLAEVRINLALAYLGLSRTADAVVQLERAATLAPDEPRVLFQLGGAYIELKELDKAAATLEKGLAMVQGLSDPLAYDAAVTLGAVYFARGDNDKAMAQFEKALAARPDAAAPRLGLGKVYFSKGDVDRALQFFRQVVSSAPGSAEAVEAEKYIKELDR